MRCPKCGFISFDHLEKCLKCSKEFKDTSGIIQGTVYNVQAPSFLKIQNETEKKKFGEDIEIDNDSLGEDFDLEDPDLEILLDEEEEVENPPVTGSSLRLEKDAGELETAPQGEFELSLDTGKDEEEDEQMSIDLGQFQNDLDDGETGLGDIFAGGREGEKVSLELPDELADISDLEPPRKQASPPPLQKSAGKGRSAEAFDFSLDLDLDGLDDSLPTPPPVKKAKKEESLSLDAIDLSTTVRPGSASRKGVSDTMNMDEELNFDLDLGGLSLHKD